MKEPVVCIREALATAVNAPDLTPGGRAVDLVGALGAAAHNRYFDTGNGRMQARLSAVGTAQINPRRRMASLLERAKYGRDKAAVRPAVYLFADYLRRRFEYRNWRVGDGNALVIAFASCVVSEWLVDRCAQCGGAGQVPIGPIRGRDTQTRTCGLCHGLGAARIEDGIRVKLLGVSHAIYQRHWIDRFSQAKCWLAAIEESNIAPLRAQLKRDMVRTN